MIFQKSETTKGYEILHHSYNRFMTGDIAVKRNMTINKMKWMLCIAILMMAGGANMMVASTTLPIKGRVVKASDERIQYIGRISFADKEAPTFNYPGIQIIAAFQGTSLRMIAKPQSGYFMAQIDGAEPFKVNFSSPRDSIISLATALPYGVHEVKLMYIMEGYERMPEFWGFVLDSGCDLVTPKPLPDRKIEFIGNSITCGYGNECMNQAEHFDYSTENHYYSYAAMTARALNAQHHATARSGIGVYRNYNGPKTGNKDCMPTEYEYTLYQRKAEKWDFNRFQPDVICINLGTNDLSTPNYDLKLLRKAYVSFIQMVRSHNPQSKIVMLTGTMLGEKEVKIQKEILDSVVKEYNNQGDQEIYRFDMTPQTGDLYYGADWHPSYWQHEKMAGELTAFLRSLMKWW